MLTFSWTVYCYSTSFTDAFTVVEKQLKTDHSLTNIVENIKTEEEGKLQSFSSVVDGEITASIGDHKDGKQALALHLFYLVLSHNFMSGKSRVRFYKIHPAYI